VKEDVISRFAELGISISDVAISFDPQLMSPEEFLKAPARFSFVSQEGDEGQITLSAGQMAFTLCQTPVIYTRAEQPGITLHRSGGSSEEIVGKRLTAIDSEALFSRRAEIARIDVRVVI
jgi:hypothetical protein